MDRELLIANIARFADAKNESPSGACVGAGIGKNFVSELKRGKTPGLASVCALAAHLDVSVSDLVGDAKAPADLAPLADAWAELNEEGRERLIAYAEDLVAGGRYIKTDSAAVDQDA